MKVRKGQEVYLKKAPKTLYGTITHIVDEGAEDPSVIVQLDSVRVHSSDVESAEIPESDTDKVIRAFSGQSGETLAQWAANPGDQRLWSEAVKIFSEAGLLKPIKK